MKNIQGPKVLYKIESVHIEIMKSTRNYPKAARYTLAERTEKALLSGTECVFYASFNQFFRMDRLREARTHFQMVTFLLRIARRLGFVSDGFYEKISEDLSEIGKMISGWIKTVESDEKGSHRARP